MPRRARIAANSGIYHVMSRGVGKQIIFEDDADRKQYLYYLYKYVASHKEIKLIAWCLMNNHVHLLLSGEIEVLSNVMRRLNTAYAKSFNTRYERTGALFQGRFKSEPVETEDYLLTVVRYIHQNPVKAGLTSNCSYPWSSYDSYLSYGDTVRNVRPLIMDMFGGESAFKKAHEDLDCHLAGDEEIRGAVEIRRANQLIAPLAITIVRGLDRKDRNDALRALLRGGFSARKIERLTGVSKSLVAQIAHGDQADEQ